MEKLSLNYKEILIGADQKNFKLMPWIHGVRYVKMGLQIICLTFFRWGIWGWILLEFLGNVANTLVINWVIRKEYPWLHTIRIQGKTLIKKYDYLITKTKQLFVHKLAYFILGQTAPLIIYAFVSLTMVTYYGNYMLLLGYVATLVNVIFDGMGASIGNLVADNNKNHTLNVFWELFTSRLWIASVACIGLLLFVEPFITLWIGKKFLLSNSTLLLMIIGVFIRMSRGVVDSFKDAYQLFGDIWAPAIEAVINLSCSIYFGYLWGLNGILLGSNLSLILIVVIWKPYYLCKNGIKESCLNYFIKYTQHLFIILGCAYVSYYISSLYSTNSIYKLIMLNLLCFILFSVNSFILFFLFTDGMKSFTNRIKNIISPQQ